MSCSKHGPCGALDCEIEEELLASKRAEYDRTVGVWLEEHDRLVQQTSNQPTRLSKTIERVRTLRKDLGLDQ